MMFRKTVVLLVLSLTAVAQQTVVADKVYTKSSPVYNVRYWGAQGNGVADDTTYINNALTACQAGQGVLYFPVGTYLISSTLVVPVDGSGYSRCAWKGELDHEISSSAGMPGSVIKTNANFTAIRTKTLDTQATTGAITSGAAILTCSSCTFSVADIGKNMEVIGAGSVIAGSGISGNLLTTISGFTNSTTVTLAANAATTVSGAQIYYGNDTIANWTKNFSISDLYIQGPRLLASANSSSIGCDFEGVQFLRAQNLHCEGFGTGLLLLNGSEITFQGRTLIQNNFNGAVIQRVNNTDMQAVFDNLVTVNNQIPLILDNPRSLFVNAGENITYGIPLGRTALNRIVIRNCANSQVHFRNYVGENDEAIAFAKIDAFGIGEFTIDQGNFETLSGWLRLVESVGYVDNIRITNSAFPRVVSLQEAIVYMHSAVTSDGNARAGTVTLEGNTPQWMDFSVKDDNVSRNPLKDYTPRWWQQVNMKPEMDQAADNRVTALGTYGFTTSNVLVGNARMTWTSAAGSNFVTVNFARPLKGADMLFLTFIVDDNAGAVVPQINSITGLPGGNPTDWQPILSAKLGSYTVGARTYTKYGIAVVIINKTNANTGISNIQLGNIYGEGTGASGLESMQVYVNTKQVGYVQPVARFVASNPGGLLSGWGSLGDEAFLATPLLNQAQGYINTTAGNPGTWSQLPLIGTDATRPLFNSVALGGDTAFSASPRAFITAFYPLTTALVNNGAFYTMDKAITITRLEAGEGSGGAGCGTFPVISVFDGTSNIATLTIAGAAHDDSGALSINVAAGKVLNFRITTAAVGCAPAPANVGVSMSYKLQ